MMRILRRLGWIGGLLWLISGSAWAETSSLLTTKDRAELEKLLGQGVILEALPSRPLLPAERYLPAKMTSINYVVHSRKEKDRTEHHNIVRDQQTGTAIYEVKGVSRRVIADDGKGNATIEQEVDLAKKVVSTFTPGQPLILAGAAPGESKQVNVNVSVADIADPAEEDYHGELKIDYAPLGRYRVKTPAGTFDADLVKWRYDGDIGPADVETTQYRFLVEGVGMVAMVEWRSISAMLVYHENTKVGKLLAAH